MKSKALKLLFVSTLALVFLTGCGAGDAPVQGQKVDHAAASSQLDTQLDKAEAMPVERRAALRKLLDPAVAKGTPAQQDRYKKIMEGVPGDPRSAPAGH